MRTFLFATPFMIAGFVILLWSRNQPNDANAAHHLALKTEEVHPKKLAAEEIPPPKPECELSLELFTQMRIGRKEARITLKNVGNTPVALVHPGDGSNCGMRTPIIRWTFIPADSDDGDDNPSASPFREGAPIRFCNIYNSVKADEVFTLQPGEWKKLRHEYAGFPTNLKPGKYHVVVHYKNDPKMQWSEGSSHDQELMQRIRESTPVDLVSNEQVIELIE